MVVLPALPPGAELPAALVVHDVPVTESTPQYSAQMALSFAAAEVSVLGVQVTVES